MVSEDNSLRNQLQVALEKLSAFITEHPDVHSSDILRLIGELRPRGVEIGQLLRAILLMRPDREQFEQQLKQTAHRIATAHGIKDVGAQRELLLELRQHPGSTTALMAQDNPLYHKQAYFGAMHRRPRRPMMC
jgi:hypothetical protein